jgi:hypothetical protein
MRTSGLPCLVSWFKPIRLLSVALHIVECITAINQKASVQGAIGIRKELGCMQRQHSMAQSLAACMQYNGGNLEHVL